MSNIESRIAKLEKKVQYGHFAQIAWPALLIFVMVIAAYFGDAEWTDVYIGAFIFAGSITNMYLVDAWHTQLAHLYVQHMTRVEQRLEAAERTLRE